MTLIGLSACAAPDKYEGETLRLQSYLKRKFALELPETTAYYVVLPGKGCSVCSIELIKMFLKDKDSKPCLHLLTVGLGSYPTELSMNLEASGQVHIDASGSLERLDIGIASAALIKTGDKKVIAIQPITLEVLASTWATIGPCL